MVTTSKDFSTIPNENGFSDDARLRALEQQVAYLREREIENQRFQLEVQRVYADLQLGELHNRRTSLAILSIEIKKSATPQLLEALGQFERVLDSAIAQRKP